MDTGITTLGHENTKTKDDHSINGINRNAINDKAKVEIRADVNGERNNHFRTRRY